MQKKLVESIRFISMGEAHNFLDQCQSIMEKTNKAISLNVMYKLAGLWSHCTPETLDVIWDNNDFNEAIPFRAEKGLWTYSYGIKLPECKIVSSNDDDYKDRVLILD